ncbi:NACHT domain-containing protein [Shewanella pealeana]|uniref:NTPase (NACHT family)-like protein n=1 Tax=Shewanella pealeana (strain ATCC 700345 / ANG-SQ1) TaxID=398579 RepID=A8H7S6_SHEPA|nr:NACHT family-like NTPase [Shewanella pealeana]ABV88613.1 NTPase (NACHT family)-like protein [Shewanella pealeana ATCC 700345]
MPKNVRARPYTSHLKMLEEKKGCLSGRNQAEFSSWVDPEKVKFAVEELRKVEFVVTIFRKEEPKKVKEFYFPCQLIEKRSPKKVNIKADTYADFNCDESIIIEGLVGHGKSILLRHLHNYELNSAATIPLFIELKDVNVEQPISEFFSEYIEKNLGFRCSEKLFESLLKIGLFSFFFDGFDEVEYDIRQNVVEFIQYVASRSSNKKIFVTTRPGNEIQRSSSFIIFSIKPLDNDEQIGFVKKLMATEKSIVQKENLQRNIDSLPKKLRELLKTPLMLTLFSMVYRNKVKIPEDHSDFYKKLFDTLVSEHDGLKLGFTRPTKTLFSADKIKTALELLSYYSIKSSELSGSKDDFIRVIKNVLLDMGEKVTQASNLLDDITRNTCLLQIDDHDYRFLHEMIPHYFAASCIKEQTDDLDAISFYGSSRRKWRQWLNVLQFLADIDTRRFVRNLYLPEVELFFEPSLLPRKLSFTSEGADMFSRNFYFIIFIGSSKEMTAEDKYKDVLMFNVSTNFLVDKHFWNPGHSNGTTEKVNLDSFIDRVYRKVSGCRQDDNFTQLSKIGVASDIEEHKVRVINLFEVLNELKLNQWFKDELNKLPLDNMKAKYMKYYELNRRKEEESKKGKFEV